MQKQAAITRAIAGERERRLFVQFIGPCSRVCGKCGKILPGRFDTGKAQNPELINRSAAARAKSPPQS